MKIVCVIPTLPSELKHQTLLSVFSQTVPVNYIYMLTEKCKCGSLPEKISAILNDGIKGLNLNCFDYILRLDADTILPNDFVEKHIALDVDVAGGAGYAQLIRTKFFVNKMSGCFNKQSDDTYTYFKAITSGSASDLVSPVEHRESGLTHSKFRYDYYTGKLDYLIGYDPLSQINLYLFHSFNLWRLLGYFISLFTFTEGFEFAKLERSQRLSLLLRRITHGKKH
jgi:hypothetical protein